MFVNKTTLYRLKAKFEGTVIKRRDPGGQAQHLKNKMKKIVQAHEDDPFLIHAKTAPTSNVSAQTVRRRLQEHGLKTIKPASKHRLTKENKEARMTCAVAHHR